jgi:EAL domain
LIRFAVEDSGIGVPPDQIGYLQHLPLDVLKVDRTFVREIEANRNAGAIVKAILVMAKAMELEPLQMDDGEGRWIQRSSPRPSTAVPTAHVPPVWVFPPDPHRASSNITS